MGKQLKSVLLSSLFAVVFIVLQLCSLWYFEHSVQQSFIGMEQIVTSFVISCCLFIAFWVMRRQAKLQGNWHRGGTILVNSLMLGLCAWGITHFLIFGGNHIPTINPDSILFQFSYVSALNAGIFPVIELLIVLANKA
ncbi:MAG: hypothetical protein IJW62_06850 [Clostridia bacterium]|nr:hypothetical protein [Clostridia bacterium]